MNINKGFTLWFTGLSGAGKTTISKIIQQRLRKGGIDIEVLDGDVVRTHLSKGLGFSPEDRDTNIRRIGWVSQLLTKHNVPNMAAAISPYRKVRAEVRKMVVDVGGTRSFIEVFVNCPVEVCEERDVKGLYAKARSGEIKQFTGISDPYEEPEAPEINIRTDQGTPDDAAEEIIEYLIEKGFLSSHIR